MPPFHDPKSGGRAVDLYVSHVDIDDKEGDTMYLLRPLSGHVECYRDN